MVGQIKSCGSLIRISQRSVRIAFLVRQRPTRFNAQAHGGQLGLEKHDLNQPAALLRAVWHLMVSYQL